MVSPDSPFGDISVSERQSTLSVLDASLGRPARGVNVKLQRYRKIADGENGTAFAFDPIAHRCVVLRTFGCLQCAVGEL